MPSIAPDDRIRWTNQIIGLVHNLKDRNGLYVHLSMEQQIALIASAITELSAMRDNHAIVANIAPSSHHPVYIPLIAPSSPTTPDTTGTTPIHAEPHTAPLFSQGRPID